MYADFIMTNKLNSDKVLTSPKRSLNVDLYYLPNCTEFLSEILENESLFQILG